MRQSLIQLVAGTSPSGTVAAASESVSGSSQCIVTRDSDIDLN